MEETQEGTPEEQTPDVLDNIARLWVLDAHDWTGTHSTSMQFLIDGVPDHNQLMLNSIEAVSPDLRKVIDELMRSESEVDEEAWTSLTNALFRRVSTLLEESHG